ncbi:hypothetical protein U91I_03895 [alpha proteobacterium U9-1i]|nr:hypothetical protein U91I_03895 [alpha proteobacterium U9-1i]
MSKAKNLLIAAVAVCLAATPRASAEEGMWTFDAIPAARMRAEIGWAPDADWLARVRAGAARLQGGCSSSIVSSEGLVLTNQHCVVGCVRDLSTAQRNLVDTGLVAATRNDELRCPGMAIQVLTDISDVTQRIGGATGAVGADGFARARDGEISRIESECSSGAVRCEVVTLYQGGRYSLYRYRRYEDVRLAFAPENIMAQYGGNLTDFEFPAHCIDFALVRLYENGAPAATPNHLRMRFTPLEAGEPVMVTGNPGNTSRLRTVSELTFTRDYALPATLMNMAELRGRVQAYSNLGPDQARGATSVLRGLENGFKSLYGRRAALVDPASFALLTSREAELRRRVNANRTLRREVGDAWGEIEAAKAAQRGFHAQYTYLEGGPGSSALFGWARDLVRGAEERAKPDSERLPRYNESRIAALEQNLLAVRPVDVGLEQIVLTHWLTRLQANLGVNDPGTIAVIGRANPDALARILTQSRLGDAAYRAQLWRGGPSAIAASEDPMIQFVRRWDGDARGLNARFQREVEGPIARAHERIARARFQLYGEEQYPDATFSLRLSYGRVAGLTEPDGREVGPFGRVGEIFANNTGAPPFELATTWRLAEPRLDPNTIISVATTNDIIGGNSGSPLVDRDGRVVGVAWDGNIHSLGGDYFYDGRLNRTVVVAATGIQAALRHVYRADALIAELER